MKSSAVKTVVLSAALSVALAVSVCGGTYRQSDVVVEDGGLEISGRKADFKATVTHAYRSRSIETFINDVLKSDPDRVDFVYNDLYSACGEEYGYVLDFSYEDGHGYAIIEVVDGTENIVEMDPKNSSPYLGKDGKYIYGSFDNYLVEQNNGDIVKLTADDGVSAMSAPMKSKDKDGVPVSIDYSYSYGNVERYEINNFYYSYSTSLCSDKKNNCANATGVIALNYWNAHDGRNFLNLTTDETKGIYDLNMKDDTARKYMNIFYDYMNTNWAFGQWGGTLPDNVYKGFKRLVNEKGRETIQFDVSSFDDIKYQVEQGVPVFFTSEDYYFTPNGFTLPTVSNIAGNNSLTIDYERTYGIENSHTFVGYGYVEFTLFDNDGKESKIQLVKVASGWGSYRYFNFNISDTEKWGMAAIYVSRC